mmetsp:Transcript_16906/g.38771  ORF Transcript_16906/g.38771 Transcript_16906/m.38771 type:complete len:342 (+) Transcript_16906:603-1628(+)
MLSACRLVTGTSAVGIKKASSPLQVCDSGVTAKRSSWNLGSWEVPSRADRPTMYGTLTSVYPCLPVCRSRKNMASARSNRAIGPLSATKRVPLILTAASDWYPFSPDATSSCHLGSKSSVHSSFLGSAPTSPHSETTSFSVSSSPSGTLSSSRFGIPASMSSMTFWMESNSSSAFWAPSAAAALSSFCFSTSAAASSLSASSSSFLLLSLRISWPTWALASLRWFKKLSRSWINATRFDWREAMVLTASRASSEARRDFMWERTISVSDTIVRMSRLKFCLESRSVAGGLSVVVVVVAASADSEVSIRPETPDAIDRDRLVTVHATDGRDNIASMATTTLL